MLMESTYAPMEQQFAGEGEELGIASERRRSTSRGKAMAATWRRRAPPN